MLLNRIRKISTELLVKYPTKFTESFDSNKLALNELADITSKNLRNELAGYITKKIKMSRRVIEESQDGQE
ncbi:MAG: 30S ribosomal protein S17e [Nitrososphaerota archaeon]|nr:30S ribosomal protein S17e [Nitrososphaerota archaeon]MDG7049194.1 30S ribosomal protein S17e [Nitrososphaerota archaeon]MDG7051280.1 30S ribosomal protein S17e [Nitrososphaerota archaeon]